ncbi:MAG: PadR family transcriptional regulator [Candidatus Thorarchaeota archaeon]
MNVANTKQQMRRGILEFCILLVISRHASYVNNILKELKKADLIVVEGTIYPLLTRLKNSGLLDYDWRESKSGPPRKYYSLTKKGKKTLQELLKTWKSLDNSINALIKKFNSF